MEGEAVRRPRPILVEREPLPRCDWRAPSVVHQESPEVLALRRAALRAAKKGEGDRS